MLLGIALPWDHRAVRLPNGEPPLYSGTSLIRDRAPSRPYLKTLQKGYA